LEKYLVEAGKDVSAYLLYAPEFLSVGLQSQQPSGEVFAVFGKMLLRARRVAFSH
jgi:hypothetical protein